ncbi:MAG TPA: amphi-Trp domain-containing protein [Polyangiaceae bacterium]|jgi:amphi-Trp domain-containing protein|nr:amphi-Trp domain-containing protein [Polyangiaceae bacterium]
MKRRKVRYVDQRNIQACIDQLQAIIDGLRSGGLGFEEEDQSLLLHPGGMLDFELRVDQLERKETLRVELSWRPALDGRRGVESGEAPVSETRQLGFAEELSEGPITARPSPSVLPSAPPEPLEPELSLAAPPWRRPVVAEYEQLYAEAFMLGSDGQWHIDRDQLVQSLARAGVDPLTQQELYSLALQADVDGRAGSFSERVIAALDRASQRPASASAAS